MSHRIEALLRICYYYAQLIGALNFEIDFRSGRARITRRSSIYAALVNAISICLLPLLSRTNVAEYFWAQAKLLHEFIHAVILVARLLCIYVTLLTRWTHRQRFVELVNAFARLNQQKPHVKRMWRRGVISKFLSVCLSDFMQTIVSFRLMRNSLNVPSVLSILIFYLLSAFANIIICHYYFGLLNIHAHYILLNRELRDLLAEMRLLDFERRRAVLVTKSLALADQLDTIARTQFQVQGLLERLTSCFGLQTLFMTISYYTTFVTMIYLMFCELTGDIRLDWTDWNVVLLVSDFLCFCVDIFISVNIVHHLLNAHARLRHILSEEAISTPGRDERLALAFNRFQMQLAWNPLKISVLGLYTMEQAKAISLASSVITSALVLIQNELKNEYLY